jgi:hypothetical protein
MSKLASLYGAKCCDDIHIGQEISISLSIYFIVLLVVNPAIELL